MPVMSTLVQKPMSAMEEQKLAVDIIKNAHAKILVKTRVVDSGGIGRHRQRSQSIRILPSDLTGKHLYQQ